METPFFKKTKLQCSSCKLRTRNAVECEVEEQPFVLHKKGKGEYLILLEMPEPKETFDKFIDWLDSNNIRDYTIANAIGCRTSNFDLPSPLYEQYKHCSMFSYEDIKDYKAILPVERALYSITQTDDIISWHEFSEYLFNDTFFYTPLTFNEKYGYMIPVYPLPKIHSWKTEEIKNKKVLKKINNTDTFMEFFARKQFKFASANSPKKFQPYKLQKVDDTDKFFEATKDEPSVSWDTETNSLDIFIDNFEVGIFTCSFDGKTGYYLDYKDINKETLGEWLRDKYQIGANLKYDRKALLRVGVDCGEIKDDVILLWHVLNTVKTKVGLKTIAWQIGFGGYDQPLEDYKKKHNIRNYLDIPFSVMFPYATLDAVVTERSRAYLYEKARLQPDQLTMYQTILIRTIEVFVELEMRGIKVNIDYLNKLSDYLVAKKEKAIKEFAEIAGRVVDLDRNEDVAEAFEKLGLPDHGKTKKGYYKTGEYQIDLWVKDKFKIANILKDYRKANKLLGTYAGKVQGEDEEEDSILSFFDNNGEETDEAIVKKGLKQYISSDGRIHPDYRFAMQYTFRSADFLALIPKKGYEGKLFRPVFLPDDDCYFGESDHAGLQLRLTASFSESKQMIYIFTVGHKDMHSESATFFPQLKGKDVLTIISNKKKEPYKTARDKSKGQINFSQIFSKDYYVLVGPIEREWSEEDKEDYFQTIPEEDREYDKKGNVLIVHSIAKDLNTKFFERYDRVKDYIHKTHEDAVKHGYVDYAFGGRRHLPYLTYVPKKTSKEELKKINGMKNISVNSKAQGTEALLMDQAMLTMRNQIKERNLKSRIAAQIHDAIVPMVHKDEAQEMVQITIDYMDDHTNFKVPLESETDVGYVWGFGTEINPSLSNEKIAEMVRENWIDFCKEHPILGQKERKVR